MYREHIYKDMYTYIYIYIYKNMFRAPQVIVFSQTCGGTLPVGKPKAH